LTAKFVESIAESEARLCVEGRMINEKAKYFFIIISVVCLRLFDVGSYSLVCCQVLRPDKLVYIKAKLLN